MTNAIEFPLQRPFAHREGHCWVADAQNVRWASDLPGFNRSSLRVFEGNRALGPQHAAHSAIESDGAGALSHWGGSVYFSTSDNSDPNLNGRAYRAVLESLPTWTPLCIEGCHVHCNQISIFDEFIKVDVEVFAERDSIIDCDVVVPTDAQVRRAVSTRAGLLWLLFGRKSLLDIFGTRIRMLEKVPGAKANVLPQLLDGQSGQFMRTVVSLRIDGLGDIHTDASQRANGAMDLVEGSVLNVRLRSGRKVSFPLSRIAESHWSFRDDARSRLSELMAEKGEGVFLEIGGRGAQSVAVRGGLGDKWRYLALDIKPGKNVDIVGDVHTMSRQLGADSVDVVYCVSVFEHLYMPWRAALEISTVLKRGGLCYVHAPYFWPVHETPWDFFRYSKYAWPALFNDQTGFEILHTGDMGVSRPVAQVANRLAVEAGFGLGPMATVVLARKIGDSNLRWDSYDPAKVAGLYPG